MKSLLQSLDKGGHKFEKKENLIGYAIKLGYLLWQIERGIINYYLNKSFRTINTNNWIDSLTIEMVFQCPRCGKNDFKKTRDLTNHLNRKFKCKQTQIPNPVQPPNPNISRPQLLVPSPPSSVVHVHEKEGSKRGQATDLSIEDLANWLANPEIKNNLTIINKKIVLNIHFQPGLQKF